MKEFFSKITKSLLEHWVVILLGSGGIAVTFCGWIYRTFLKNWLTTKYSLELHGLELILVFLAIVGLTILLMLVKKKPKRDLLTDLMDVKGAIEDWFNDSYLDPPFETETSIFFRDLDDSLNIKKGSSRKYLPILACDQGYGIEFGEKTFRLVSLTVENNLMKIFQEYLTTEKDAKEWLIPTHEIDNKLFWPKGTTKNSLLLFLEFCGNFCDCKVEDKGNGNILLRSDESAIDG